MHHATSVYYLDFHRFLPAGGLNIDYAVSELPGYPFSVILRVSHYRRSRNMFAAGQLHLCSDMIHSKFYIKSTSEIVGGNRPDGDIFDPRDPKVSRTRFWGPVITSECSRRRAHCWVESETKRSLTCKICFIVGGVRTLWRSRPSRRLVRRIHRETVSPVFDANLNSRTMCRDNHDIYCAMMVRSLSQQNSTISIEVRQETMTMLRQTRADSNR